VVGLAGRQWGVVSRTQLRELGVTAATVDVWLRRGRLLGLHRGVYAVGHSVLRSEGRWLAAVLACGEGAVLSHRSAAAHWGLLQSAASLIDVTAPASRHGAPGIRLHRTRSLPLIARDTTTHQGIPITTVAKTLLDLAATTRPDHLERALAQAERLQLYDHTALTDVIARANGHRGRAILAQATTHEPKLTRSDLEAWFLAIVRDTDLPEPLTNFTLTAPDHPRLEVDFYWPTHHLVVELDGYETHRTRAAFERDRARDAALTAAGQRVLRFTWRTQPATIRRRLEAVMHH
jgi:predicted transcriptional regulator of viral defense system